MGAFLSGLLGAAGQDIEKQSDRAYQEKRQERMDRMQILQLALSNPNLKPEQIAPIMNDLQDIADDAKFKSANKGAKDTFKQMAKPITYIFGRQKQQQQQQAAQQQARSDIQGAPGVTAQPAGAGMPPMSAATQRIAGRVSPEQFYTEAENTQRRRRLGEEEFQTGLEHGTQTSQATFDQKLKEVDQLIKQGYPKQEAQQIVFGKGATPPGQKFAPFYVSGAQVPPETQIDALGNPIDREKGLYKLEETTGKFYPAAAAPKTAAGADELAKWAKILRARNPKLTPEQAVQQAANELFKGKFINPQERIQLQRDAVRTFVGEAGTLTVPTHVRGAMGGAVTPPMPPRPPGAPVPTTAGVPTAGGGVATPFPSGFMPKIPAAERTAMDTAQGVMESATRVAKELPQLMQKYPNRFGTFAGRATTAQMPESGVPLVQGTAPPELAGMYTDLHSVAAFLTGVHRARGVGYANLWAKVLGNPFVNPQFTTEAVKRAAKIADAVQRRAAQGSRAAVSMDDVIRDLQRSDPSIFSELDTPPASTGRDVSRGTSGGDLSKVSTDELIKRLAVGAK